MYDVAIRRAMDIYRKWAWNGKSKIETLVASLYLQGVNDTVDAGIISAKEAGKPRRVL